MQMRREAGIRSLGERRLCEPTENYPEVTLIPIHSSLQATSAIADELFFRAKLTKIRRAIN